MGTIVTLQETKLDIVDRHIVLETLGPRFVENFVDLLTAGTRGTILVAVDEDHYKITDTKLGVHSVTVKLMPGAGIVEWCLTTVYGPQEDNEKIQFLGELR